MFGLDRNTTGQLVVLIAGVLLFNGLTRVAIIGEYFQKYPLIILALGILLLIFRDKIASVIGK